MDAFAPRSASTVKLAAFTTTDRVRFRASGVGLIGSVRVLNAGSVSVFVAFGDSSVTATLPAGTNASPTAGSMAIPAGAVETFSLRGGAYIAGITASGTADLYITPGEGL